MRTMDRNRLLRSRETTVSTEQNKIDCLLEEEAEKKKKTLKIKRKRPFGY